MRTYSHKVMKSTLLVILAPVMAICTLAVCQTLEFCMNNSLEIPVIIWIMLMIIAAYIVLCATLKEEEKQEIDKVMDKINHEQGDKD